MHGDAWSAAALNTHPEIVRQVHQDYILAGADVIITNTFSTCRHILEPAGMGELVREMNSRAVALAREAREAAAADRPVCIAGSISTFAPRNRYRMMPPDQQAKANYHEQAQLLAGAGVDLITLEMMVETRQSAYAIEAAVATGLPTWVGFSCTVSEDGSQVQLLDSPQESFAAGIEALMAAGGSLASIMHTEVEHTAAALRVLRERWGGPIGAYSHSGGFTMPNWRFEEAMSPQDYLAEANRWVESGVQVIGGCCGTGPEHIRLLRERLPTRIPSG